MYDDHHYVEGLREGNPTIIDEIYQRFLPEVISFIIDLSGTEKDGKEVFKRAIEAITKKAKEKGGQFLDSFESLLKKTCKEIWDKLRGRKQHADYRYIKGLWENNNKVVAEINELYKPRVIAYVKKNSGSDADGEDLYGDAIEAILKMKNKETFRLTSSFWSYLKGVCYNLWMGVLRDRKKLPQVSSLDDVQQFVMNKNAIKEKQEGEEEEAYEQYIKEMWKYVAVLSDKKRLLLYLRFFKRLSFKEIAKLLGYSSENSARQAFFRIMKELRDNFEG